MKQQLMILIVFATTLSLGLSRPVSASSAPVSNTGTMYACPNIPDWGVRCATSSAELQIDSGETDPNYDYYAVKLTVQVQHPPPDNYVSEVWVDLTFPSSAQESPSNHQPQMGCTGSATAVTFVFYGISIPLTVPATCTDYSSSLDTSGFHVHWHQCASPCGDRTSVTFDYTEFAVGVIVPEGGSIPVSIHTGARLCAGDYFYGLCANTDTYGSLYACCSGVFQDFGIVVTPASAPISAGQDATSTITLTSRNNFAGVISLVSSFTPVLSSNPSPSVNPGSVSLSAGESGTSILKVSSLTTTQQGTYYVRVTATSGAISHQYSVALQVGPPPPPPTYVFPATFTQGGFTGSTINVCAGTDVSVRITLSATTTFTGPVDVQIRRDIVGGFDDTLTTLSKIVTLNSGNNQIEMGSFTVGLTYDPSNVRQYYLKVFWSYSASPIYDPTDPNTREKALGRDCSPGGGGGGGGGSGSIAHGSLITMADGSKVPVQNLREGDNVAVYDVQTGYETVAVVTKIQIVTVDSLLTIHTSIGLPFRADANPSMKLHVLVNNEPALKPITEIRPGDWIYSYDHRTWVEVTNVTIAFGGRHVMYDLVTDPIYSPTGSVLEYIANGYPDCPTACKI